MNTQPYCPEYETIVVPDITAPSPDNSHSAGRVLLDFQGSFVLLSQRSHFDSVLRMFKDIRDVAVELVVESPQGDQFLTPWHTDDPVIRDIDIVTDFADMDISSYSVDMSAPSAKSRTIDLQKFWDADIDRFDAKDLDRFFASFFSEFRPVRSLTLVGAVPLVPLIIVAFLLYGSVGEMWYGREEGADTLQIF